MHLRMCEGWSKITLRALLDILLFEGYLVYVVSEQGWHLSFTHGKTLFWLLWEKLAKTSVFPLNRIALPIG